MRVPKAVVVWVVAAWGLGVGCRSEPPAPLPAEVSPNVAAPDAAAASAPEFVHPDVGGVSDPLAAAPMSEEEQAVRREVALNKQRARTEQQMEMLAIGITRYVSEGTVRELPTHLYDLVEPPSGRAPLASPEEIKDAWGNEIIFTAKPDRHYTLRSVGPDNRFGGEDDLVLER